MYKVLKRLFGRAFLIILSVLFQIGWFSLFMTILGYRYPVFAGLVRAVSVGVVLWLVNRRTNPSYKLAWIILILSLPMVGFSVYLLFGRSRLGIKIRGSFEQADQLSRNLMQEDEAARAKLAARDEQINRQSVYLRDFAHFPVYRNTSTEYFSEGEALFHKMTEELEKARHFIFMEYFIIDNGEMWSTILQILEKKAAQGLDVRIIYDDVGCVNTLPAKFYKELRQRGIKCEVFNPFKPVVSVVLNNRDHRKIMVIDGNTGFTGGINLADEYINRKQRFGHWKDTGIMLKGEAVWNFTVMFLQMWCVITGSMDELKDADKYRIPSLNPETGTSDGYVQPFSDTPLDQETVGENVYLNIIGRAKKYVYIFTPYLIIDNEMMTALCLAAKSGVDVRIVTPGIPDKRMVFTLTRSYYEQLLDAGVGIYEYVPGFLHAKCCICDDEVAVVGTINLDYRSLYLHFECGVWMYDSRAVLQVKEDAASIIHISRKVTQEECRARRLPVRLIQSLLRLMAPML